MNSNNSKCFICSNKILSLSKNQFEGSFPLCESCKNNIEKNDGIYRQPNKNKEIYGEFIEFYDSMYDFNRMNLDVLYEIKKKPVLITFALRKMLEDFVGKINPRVVADLGCGRGENLISIADKLHNSKIIANDVSYNALQICNFFLDKSNLLPNSLLICSPLEKLELPHESVDLVICTEVLEHVINDDLVLRKINNFLKPGGYAFISTHCEKELKGTVSFDLRRILKEGAHGSAAGGDLREYSYNDLIKKIETNNFKIVSEKWCGNIFGNLAYRLNNFLLEIGKKITGVETNKKDKYCVKSIVSSKNEKLLRISNFYLSYLRKFLNCIYWLDVLLNMKGKGHVVLIVEKL